jgi:Carboxypeptidase regulatory-like domain
LRPFKGDELVKSCQRFVLVIAVLLCTHPAFAQQETATVIGEIVDPQGAALPGVSVTARNVDTGFTRSGVSDEEGRYRIAAVPPELYELTAELQGSAAAVQLIGTSARDPVDNPA